MKKLNIYILLVLSFMMASCQDFLTRYPDTAIPEEKAMQTLEDCSEVVLGIYSCFKNSGLYSGALTLAPDLQSDYVYAVKGYTNTYGDIYRWEIRANDSYVGSAYAGLYQIASRCNFFMDYKDQVYSTLTSKSQIEEFNRRLADVYFARALAYADLIRTFCEAYDPQTADKQLGISLVQTYKGTDIVVPRSSLKDSYEFVLADLDNSERMMTREGADSKFFTKGAIWALKARVYLYMHEWAKAKEYAEKVMNLKYYALADATTIGYIDQETNERITEYDVMWRYDEGKEVIWKIAMSTTDKGGSLGRIFLGFNSSKYYPDYIPGKEVLSKYDDNDYRYYSYFGNVKTGYGFDATLLKKYPGNADIDAGSGRYFVNMPKVFRLSETYLIHAEASANLGDYTSANNSLNALKAKRIKGYSGGRYDDTKIMKEIQDERFRELIMEGFRLSDLKRWNLGFERKKQQNTIDGPNNNQLKVSPDCVEFTWPIPQHELDATGGVVAPNPSNKK